MHTPKFSIGDYVRHTLSLLPSRIESIINIGDESDVAVQGYCYEILFQDGRLVSTNERNLVLLKKLVER